MPRLGGAGSALTTLTGSEEIPFRDDTFATARKVSELGAEIVEVTASATLGATHAGKFVSANHATVGITLTVPPNSTFAFPVGCEIHVRQTGAAAVTIAQGSGVTITQPATQTLVLAERYAVVTLKKMATDTWALFGMLTAA